MAVCQISECSKLREEAPLNLTWSYFKVETKWTVHIVCQIRAQLLMNSSPCKIDILENKNINPLGDIHGLDETGLILILFSITMINCSWWNYEEELVKSVKVKQISSW